MARLASLFALMLVLWLVMSGHGEVWLLALGAASAALVAWISRRLESVDHEGHPLHLTWRGLGYWPWLAVEIVKANLDVARTILAGPGAVAPAVFTVKASQSDDLGRTIYANSITLTPGTVTMGMEDDGTLTIHALNAGARDGLDTGDMDRRVSKLMGEA
ncbi:MAG: Na+/H+ antiporter subunit E [Magnetospirillum sp.]|nr:Na+/H+ antiporter subunit E [Magnetospirillum sp.]